MEKKAKFVLVLVTAPDLKTARLLSKAALQARLIACVNLIRGIESHYWWHEKLEAGSEVLMLCKTTTAHLARLEKLMIAKHPYDTPEFLVISIKGGSRRYLQWLKRACG